MKTTKDIAELFTAEIERIAKGEVRKDVIGGLERCSNALIKLARLEMDFAWKDWDVQAPNVPWLSTKSREPAVIGNGQLPSTRIKALCAEIENCQKQMVKATPTMKAILEDKIKAFQAKLDREIDLEKQDEPV